MSPGTLLALHAVGAALIGFWFVVRFPTAGPQRLPSAVLLVAGAVIVLSPLPTLVAILVSSLGVPAALLLVVVPSLALLFWAAGCLIRVVCDILARGSIS